MPPSTLFTAETARKAALASVAARRLNAQRLKAIAKAALDNPQTAAQPPAQVDDYSARRIMRVREQLNRIDDMLLREEDPQKIDRLASAQLRLSEQERILAGRPLPGSRKPAPERRQSAYDAALAPVPVPVQSDPPAATTPQADNSNLPGKESLLPPA